MDVIKTIEYPGSLGHFRAFMEQLLTFHRSIWKLEHATYYFWHESDAEKPYRDAWEFLEKTPEGLKYWDAKAGLIYALEKYPNKTTVQFIDGVNITGFFLHGTDSPKMGEDLEIISSEIITQIQSVDSATVDNQVNVWERIPNVGWYREAIKLWHERKTTAEIAQIIGRREQTVRNKIAELRKIYGEEVVPKRRQ